MLPKEELGQLGKGKKTCFGKQVKDPQPGKFGDSERKC